MKKHGKWKRIIAGAAVLIMSFVLPVLAPQDLLLVQADNNSIVRQLSSQKDSKEKPCVIYRNFNRKYSVIMVGKGDMNGYEWKEANRNLIKGYERQNGQWGRRSDV